MAQTTMCVWCGRGRQLRQDPEYRPEHCQTTWISRECMCEAHPRHIDICPPNREWGYQLGACRTANTARPTASQWLHSVRYPYPLLGTHSLRLISPPDSLLWYNTIKTSQLHHSSMQNHSISVALQFASHLSRLLQIIVRRTNYNYYFAISFSLSLSLAHCYNSFNYISSIQTFPLLYPHSENLNI